MQKPNAAAIAAVRARFVDRPLAILPSRAELLAQALRSVDAMEDFDDFAAAPAAPKLYDVVCGVAVIGVRGILVHEISWFGWYCGGETEYAQLARAMVAAMSDPEVKAVVLHVNSPGGEVAGCFDLVDGIYGLRGIKPIWAIFDEEAYSAAYAIASAADKIIVPRTGGSGSIGVITMHMDITGFLDKVGVKVTTIQYGARKSDRYPTTPLSDDAHARIQADIDAMGELFVSTVARNRNLSPDKVRSTEAGCFLGASGLEQGLVDAVMAPDAAFLSLLETLIS
jgi:signal peptide peptidase SppA